MQAEIDRDKIIDRAAEMFVTNKMDAKATGEWLHDTRQKLRAVDGAGEK